MEKLILATYHNSKSFKKGAALVPHEGTQSVNYRK
jgi:hypothetical protein